MEDNFEEAGQYYMVRCYKCKRENYLPAVATGQCVWCGEVGSRDKELASELKEFVQVYAQDTDGNLRS